MGVKPEAWINWEKVRVEARGCPFIVRLGKSAGSVSITRWTSSGAKLDMNSSFDDVGDGDGDDGVVIVNCLFK